MQDRFPWYVQPSGEEFGSLWEEATFVFDTNILLDLYRRSRSFKEDFFNVLGGLDGRIWLPHQVAEEFMRNRSSPISSQLQALKTAEEKVKAWWEDLRELNSLKEELENIGSRKGPIEREIDDLLDERGEFRSAGKKFRDRVLKSLDDLREELIPPGGRARRSEDDTLRRLEDLFDGKIGESYDEERLEEIYAEGEKRYADEIPPGFGDAEEKDDESRKYADLVVWKQILDYASDDGKDIVFVTRDTEKEDWWEERSGRTVGPLPHLRKEFREEVGACFWMYQGRRFLDRAKDELQVEVKDTSIEEARQWEADRAVANKLAEENLPAIARAMLHTQELNEIPLERLRETLQKSGVSMDRIREMLRQARKSQSRLAEIRSALNEAQVQVDTSKFFNSVDHAREIARLASEMRETQDSSVPQSDTKSPEDRSESDQESQGNSSTLDD